jgi:coenzyme Q-binding protein COQ10
MPSFEKRQRVSFSARQMYDLVADVERYPEFLPMCESLAVRRREVVNGCDVLTATMAVGYKALKESFTTRVTLMPRESQILVAYLDGPFRRLENRWRFVPDLAGALADKALVDAGGSVVDFYIDYEFRSALLAVVMGALFDKAFRRFTQAFEERARVVYGSNAAAGIV